VLENILEALPTYFAVGAGGGGGFMAVKWLLEWVAGRLDKREAVIDAATQNLIKGLETRLAGTEKRLTEVEDQLRSCQRQHAESEAKVLKLEALLQGQGEIKQLASAFVAADAIARERGGEKK
jgi:hypothetical protein